jgi:hypothetical protein
VWPGTKMLPIAAAQILDALIALPIALEKIAGARRLEPLSGPHPLIGDDGYVPRRSHRFPGSRSRPVRSKINWGLAGWSRSAE